MKALRIFWTGLGLAARLGFCAGLLLIALLVGGLGYWALHTEYGVLFSDLSERDMSSMVASLDKMKLPYRLGADGRSLLVPESQVHRTRLALMEKDVPLHGAVGFELFNNMEFGVSEFVQKVNYQRALQGELTRTILAIDEVESARVHLALPEQGLFRRDAAKPKASVTVTTKAGRTLQPAQVQGIQRLVAASVPEVQARDVTVLDQHGVALSRTAADAESDAADGVLSQLDAKRGAEAYLSQKALKVLDRVFGAGESVVSVDAVFSHEQSRVTTEEVLPARGQEGDGPATGVVLRERQTTREAAADGGRSSAPAVVNSETDYQTGRRTEQVVTPAGVLRQLNVAVVVKRSLDEAELQRVSDLVAASVGAVRSRGDVVTVHSMQQLQVPAGDNRAPMPERSTAPGVPSKPDGPRAHVGGAPTVMLWGAAAICALLAAAVFVARRRREQPVPVQSVPLLTELDRVRMLQTIRQWAAQDATQAGS